MLWWGGASLGIMLESLCTWLSTWTDRPRSCFNRSKSPASRKAAGPASTSRLAYLEVHTPQHGNKDRQLCCQHTWPLANPAAITLNLTDSAEASARFYLETPFFQDRGWTAKIWCGFRIRSQWELRESLHTLAICISSTRDRKYEVSVCNNMAFPSPDSMLRAIRSTK